MKKLYRKILDKRIEIPNWLFMIGLIGIPMVGIVCKNILLQGYFNGDTMYSPHFITAFSETWRYWIYYFAITLMVLSLGLIHKKNKKRARYMLICDIIISIIIYIDVIYGRSFFTMPSVANVVILKNFSGLSGGEVYSLLSWYDLLFLLDFVIYTVFLFRFKSKSKPELEVKVERKYRWGTVVACMACSIMVISAIPLEAKVLDVNEELYSDIYEDYDAAEQAKYFSSLGFHVRDVYELIKYKFASSLSEDDKELISEYYNWKNEDIPDNEYKGIFEGKNVLFLQIESLESFVIGQSVDGQEITPNINKLTQKGFQFTNIFEQVQGGNSSDADLMYETSRLPQLKGATFFNCEDVELTSFTRFLTEQGYSTLYSQAVRGSFWNYEKALSKMCGLDNFVGSESYDMSGLRIGFTLNDADFLSQAEPYVESLKEPYYSRIVCNTSHMPFELPEDLKELKLSDELDDSYIGGYLQSVRYVDTQLGIFLDKLRAAGKLDNTVIVIIGDHCGIHKYYEYDLPRFYDEYPWFNNNGNYTVNLIIHSDDMDTSVKSDIIAGQIDVMPTMCYLFGVDEDRYKYAAMGRNLLKTNRSYAIYRTGEVYGDLTDKEKKLVSQSYKISDTMFSVGE